MALPNFLSLQQEALLGSILAKYGLTSINYSAHSNTLNSPQQVPNDPAPEVPRSLSLDDLKTGLESATLAKIVDSGAFGTFYAAIQTQDHTAATDVIGLWESSGGFTTKEISELTTLTSLTMATPGWPETKAGTSIWQAEFYAVYPAFLANVDGSNYTDQCHPLFVKEARGDAS